MKQLKRQILTLVAAGSVALSLAAPAFASTTLQISGNGSSSDNTATVSTTNTTTVVQSNDAKISNDVSTTGSTGGNSANDNTGGDVAIHTGSSGSLVDVSTQANLNQAVVNDCNCNADSTVTISGNGSSSDNTANLTNTGSTELYQTNEAYINNDVKTKTSTGQNDANRNTGGDVTVTTGDAQAVVGVSNTANANLASVGGGTSGSGSVDLKISGNGSSSDNSIDLTHEHSLLLDQSNDAWINNNVEVKAKTGGNDANDNTGGDVTVRTGWAQAELNLDNRANFNVAEAGCDCLLDVLGKVSGNGSESENQIRASLSNETSNFQTNDAWLGNNVSANGKTGYNDANRNTGPVLGDAVLVSTGDTFSQTTVSNSANANLFGPSATLPGGLSLDFSFSLGDLFGSLHV